MARLTTSIEEKSCEEFYEEVDRNGVGGFMLVFVIWLLIFNPLLTLFNSNPVIEYLHVLSLKLNYPLADLVYRLNQMVMLLLIAGGIVLGYRVNKLYKGSLELSKLYLVIHTIFVLTLVFVTIPVILTAIEKHAIVIPAEKITKITRLFIEMNFRLWSTLVIFGIWYAYLSYSKRVKSLFHPDKCE